MLMAVKNIQKILIGLVLLIAVWASPASFSNGLAEIPAFSPDVHLNHSKAVVADEETAYPYGTVLGKVDFGLLPQSADVDVVHGLSNGGVLFSLETSIVLGGTLYRPCDVIRFDGGTWSKEFDGRNAGIPDGVNVDAIAMSGGTLLLSLDVDAQLGPTTYSDADVIAFDGLDFSIFLDATVTGIGNSADVDALHVDGQGSVLVSFDGAGDVGGIHYRDEDMLAYFSPNWSLEFVGSVDDSAWQAADLDAWSIVFIDDNIFADGFE